MGIELTVHDDDNAEQPTSKRFDVELFIVHPTVDRVDKSRSILRLPLQYPVNPVIKTG